MIWTPDDIDRLGPLVKKSVNAWATRYENEGQFASVEPLPDGKVRVERFMRDNAGRWVITEDGMSIRTETHEFTPSRPFPVTDPEARP